MIRRPVSSSSLRSVGYDTTREILEVEFRNGGVYQYFGVPSSAHLALLGAPSLGAFVNRQIKKAYPYTRLTP